MFNLFKKQKVEEPELSLDEQIEAIWRPIIEAVKDEPVKINGYGIHFPDNCNVRNIQLGIIDFHLYYRDVSDSLLFYYDITGTTAEERKQHTIDYLKRRLNHVKDFIDQALDEEIWIEYIQEDDDDGLTIDYAGYGNRPPEIQYKGSIIYQSKIKKTEITDFLGKQKDNITFIELSKARSLQDRLSQDGLSIELKRRDFVIRQADFKKMEEDFNKEKEGK